MIKGIPYPKVRGSGIEMWRRRRLLVTASCQRNVVRCGDVAYQAGAGLVRMNDPFNDWGGAAGM